MIVLSCEGVVVCIGIYNGRMDVKKNAIDAFKLFICKITLSLL
jgi:hypothetical protein